MNSLQISLKLFTLTVISLLVMTGCGESPTSKNSSRIKPVKIKKIEIKAPIKPVELSAEATAILESFAKGFYSVVILHKGESTKELHDVLAPMITVMEKCSCITANVEDKSLYPIFKELNLDPETVPTPLAIVIAPNKLVTGVFMKPPTKVTLLGAILPEQPLAVRKALSEGKTVILKMQSEKTTGNIETDKALKAYLTDPKNKNKYVSLPVDLDKQVNYLFLKQLNIDPAKETKSILLCMAPPLKIVNTPFRGAAKKADVDKAVNSECGSGCAPGST